MLKFIDKNRLHGISEEEFIESIKNYVEIISKRKNIELTDARKYILTSMGQTFKEELEVGDFPVNHLIIIYKNSVMFFSEENLRNISKEDLRDYGSSWVVIPAGSIRMATYLPYVERIKKRFEDYNKIINEKINSDKINLNIEFNIDYEDVFETIYPILKMLKYQDI